MGITEYAEWVLFSPLSLFEAFDLRCGRLNTELCFSPVLLYSYIKKTVFKGCFPSECELSSRLLILQ